TPAAPIPQPGQPAGLPPKQDDRTLSKLTPPLQSVPPTGVVTVPADQFGSRKVPTRLPLTNAREVLSKTPVESQTPPLMPIFADSKPKIDAGIRAARPAAAKTDNGP